MSAPTNTGFWSTTGVIFRRELRSYFATPSRPSISPMTESG